MARLALNVFDAVPMFHSHDERAWLAELVGQFAVLLVLAWLLHALRRLVASRQ
jgi:hypothetical protein